MDDSDDRRARQDATELAHSMVLRELVMRLIPEGERAARRDLLCDAVESIYADKGVTQHAHLPLQMALERIEAIFAPPWPEQKK